MARVVRLRPARALLLGGVLAVGAGMPGCGTDTIDLLPLSAGRGGDGSTPAGAGGEGPSDAGRGGSAGSGSGGADVAGAAGNSGSAGQDRGGSGGCSGFGCGGFGGSSGSGGEGFDCAQFPMLCNCGSDGKCDFGLRCHPTERTCVEKCDVAEQCGNSGRVCSDHLCSRCTSNQDCEQYGTFQRHVCVQAFGVCLECAGKSDCPPERPLCDGGRCVECVNDDDCQDNEHCDELRGRCTN